MGSPTEERGLQLIEVVLDAGHILHLDCCIRCRSIIQGKDIAVAKLLFLENLGK